MSIMNKHIFLFSHQTRNRHRPTIGDEEHIHVSITIKSSSVLDQNTKTKLCSEQSPRALFSMFEQGVAVPELKSVIYITILIKERKDTQTAIRPRFWQLDWRVIR